MGNDSTQRSPSEEIYASLAIRRIDALDDAAANLFRARNFVVVSTLRKNGVIQAKPMWVDTDGKHVILNSEADRAWVRNLRRDPRVTCTVMNHEVPYEFVEISGHALPATPEGAIEHADFLAAKYLDLKQYPYHNPDNPRVLIKVVPDRIIHMRPPAEGALPDALDGTSREASAE